MVGGIETMIFSLAKQFIKNGYDVTVIETQRKGLWVEYFHKNNINVISIVPHKLFSKLRHAIRLSGLLKQFDIIIFNDAPFAQSIIGMLDKKTLVFPVLHSSPDSMIKNAVSNKGQWNKIVYVSPFLSSKLLDNYNLKDSDIMNIPNGVCIPDGSGIPKDFSKKVYKFIYIGRLEHSEKAILFIPDIVQKVLLHINIGEVNIYGEGSSEEALRKRIAELSLDGLIKLHGIVEHSNVYSLLKEHDFLLLPSFIEGHPITLLEAMANRTIPFVSDLPGRTDFVVEHGVNGFLCKPADIEDFSAKIIEALGRPDLEQIADRARSTIIKKFSAEAMGRRYIELIEKENKDQKVINRSNKILIDLLGDLPFIPIILVRPVRKMLRLLHLWKEKDTGYC